MGKTFYTERDIEDIERSGERTLVVGEDVVLTDLAYEAAHKLHVELVQPHDNPPGAPVRPYINKPPKPAAAPLAQPTSSRIALIKERVQKAVKERLGSQVDEVLIDRVIDRVAAELGLK
jgi:hypothetical protein